MPETLQARIHALLPALSTTQARIADEVLRNPAAVSASTIGELAARCGTSLPSVTRFCIALGLGGYAELRLALAAENARDAADSEPGAGVEIGPDTGIEEVLRVLVSTDIQAITETAAGLDLEALGQVVQAVSDARRIDLYAVSGSASVAEDLGLRLHRIGRAASTWSDVHNALTSAVLLGPGDVAIGISHSGETVEVLEPLRLAASQGAKTVAVTNSPRSPLARAAEVVLLTAARDLPPRTGGMACRHAQLIILEALYLGVAQRDRTLAEHFVTLTADAITTHREPTY